MHELFFQIAMDGLTSTIPSFDGEPHEEHVNLEPVGQVDVRIENDSIRTPKSTSSLGKRSISTCDTARSPSKAKRSVSSVCAIMQGLVDTYRLCMARTRIVWKSLLKTY